MTPQQLMDLPYAGQAQIELQNQGDWRTGKLSKKKYIEWLKSIGHYEENTADALEALK